MLEDTAAQCCAGHCDVCNITSGVVQRTLTQGVVMLQAGLTLKQFKEVVVALGAVDPMFKVVQHGIGVNVRRRTHHTCLRRHHCTLYSACTSTY